ncbi:hypothetical protein [Flexivirga caeni]|uniref:hypothetical protein n=1 Tax=Flexivirga caeni TaxID=2294115 RepID=UPI0011CDED31|nr:hypothetical protein [Flexivirga caeni]
MIEELEAKESASDIRGTSHDASVAESSGVDATTWVAPSITHAEDEPNPMESSFGFSPPGEDEVERQISSISP